MGLWGSRNGNGDGNGQSLVLARPKIGPIQDAPPRREEYGDADFIWRCRGCGATGTSRASLHEHVAVLGRRCSAEDIREYVPREVYKEEYEATAQELSASGIWVVVKMSEDTPEGSIKLRYRGEPFESKVIEADSGLEAIKTWYTQQIANLSGASTEKDREEANGRYVAIDFFTGHRCEALVESEWRANVDVAEGSHA